MRTSRWLRLFFPTEVVHTDTQVMIEYHSFLSSQIHTIDIVDLLNVELDTMLCFADVTFAVRGYIETSSETPENIISISGLWKRDAEEFVREIEKIED